MRVAVMVAVVLLMGPLVSGSSAGSNDWNQSAGGPGRAGVANLGTDPLDVRGIFHILGEDEFFTDNMEGLNALSTPSGITVKVETVGNFTNPSMCYWLRLVDVADQIIEQGPSDQCNQQREAPLVAYDAAQDVIITCPTYSQTDSIAYGTNPILMAIDAKTEELVWQVTIADAGIQQAPWTWHCYDAALDEERRQVVVPYHAGPAAVLEPGSGRNRVIAVDVDSGSVEWSAAVPVTAFGAGAPPHETGEMTANAEDQGFEGEYITLTETGVVVAGSFYGSERAVAWLDLDGRVVGGVIASDLNQESDASRSQATARSSSEWAASQGPHAVIALGDEVLLIDPLTAAPLARQPIDSALVGESTSVQEQGGIHPGPKWVGDTVVVLLQHGVVAYDANDLSRKWSWFGGARAYVSDALITSGDDIYILTADEVAAGDTARLVRLDLSSGYLLQELPLMTSLDITSEGTEGFNSYRWLARIMPVPDGTGALIYDRLGTAIYVGAASDDLRPEVEISDPYPSQGEDVVLDIVPPKGRDPSQLLVSWGEGSTVESVTEERAVVHRFSEAGPRTVRVTALYEDGRTATSEVTANVGETPPPKLNWVQERFSQENLDMTWGVIGVMLVLLGALASLLWRLLGRGRISAGLRELARIREEGKDDPVHALRRLNHWHVDQEGRLVHGRLTEDQFRVLEGRAARLLKSLARTAIEPFAVDLTAAFKKKLDATLADGFVDPVEVAQLRQAAKQQRLSRVKRNALDALLDAWS